VKIGCTAVANETLALPHVHAPATHVWPTAQEFPQAPQLLVSVCVSAHTAPQTMPPPGQMQADAWHVVPWAQTVPQAPQLAGSVAVLRHCPLQSDVPAGH
jgi:hypothetical protein